MAEGTPRAGVAVPEGWVLVPREPTQEMLNAVPGTQPNRPQSETDWIFCEAWQAMLAALPKAPSPPPSDDLRAENERLRLAYKTGHTEGYTDATDDGTGTGYCDRDAAEEGWQQYYARIQGEQK